MAFLRIDLFSKSLMRTVPITAVVPVDNVRYNGEPEREITKPYKVLYLLNGIYGNNMDWSLAGDVYMMAQERNLIVIMPAGENKFYVDNSSGEAYGKFIGEELPERMRRMFHISSKREDTFICGLSMGGYGAIRNGLKYADVFGYAAGLSPAFVQEMINKSDNASVDYTQRRAFYQAVFGDLKKLAGSDMDCEALFLERKEKGLILPKIYQAIGTEDFLLEANRKFHRFMERQGVPASDYVYEENPGTHDFVFWNEHLKHVFEWLPLENKSEGISSGNVKREN